MSKTPLEKFNEICASGELGSHCLWADEACKLAEYSEKLEERVRELEKIEAAAKAIDAEWFIDYEECPEEVLALHKALEGKS